MGEAKRKFAAALASDAFPGGPKRCPKCLGLRVAVGHDFPGKGFYSNTVAVCADCEIAWEPLDEALVWDRTDAQSSFREPCENCAFRPGSNEQADREKWREMIGKLRAGGSFYCHKGVVIDPSGEHGFAYPKDTSKLRVCRGYLNALGKWWKLEGPATVEGATP